MKKYIKLKKAFKKNKKTILQIIYNFNIFDKFYLIYFYLNM